MKRAYFHEKGHGGPEKKAWRSGKRHGGPKKGQGGPPF